MDQTLLKYWKTCLQDAERKAIALKGPRITLNIGDKILKFIPLKSIPVIFPDYYPILTLKKQNGRPIGKHASSFSRKQPAKLSAQ